MGLGDRLRAWLRGEDPSGQRSGPPAPSGAAEPSARRSPRAGTGARSRRRGRSEHPAGSFEGTELLEFARSRRGVEVYLEPRTRLYGHSVLLVADDGEYLRRPVPDAPSARRFCAEHGIPIYDAARTGYPRRVRDYDRGVRPDRVELDDLPPWPGAEQDREPEAGIEEEPPPAPPAGD